VTRILWHSADPAAGTGYGTQTALWTRYLRDHGHDVAISTYYGSPGRKRRWEGMTVYPPPQDGIVTALIPGHAREHRAEVIIILADVWLMDPRLFRGYRTLAWVPADCQPLSVGDAKFLLAGQLDGIRGVAMSEHGQRVMQAAGLDPGYVPHAIDTSVYRPDPGRDALRAAYGISPETFAIGINANNIDPVRKAYPEQMMAFSIFHKKHPDSVLLIHAIADMQRSLNLLLLARTLGITDCVRLADQYRLLAGDYSDAEMARWYCALDLLSNATYGEGFGLPTVEAQACGTPVVVSDGTTGRQLSGPGWLVPTEPYWNPVHGAWWHKPSVNALVKAYEKAYSARSPMKSQACRAFAAGYDIGKIGPRWLSLLEESCPPRSQATPASMPAPLISTEAGCRQRDGTAPGSSGTSSATISA
jgi:glycosyltransferase involved in cell wall biosynthesis